jgi:hypothetical protein
MRIAIILLFISTTLISFGQSNISTEWTDKETKQYKTLVDLAKYVYRKGKTEISKDLLFERYIEFNYVLNDTSTTRIKKRIESFDTLFYYFRKPIDSLGVDNLDARPIRFYKNHEIYKPFEEQLAQIAPDVFVYFEKGKPDEPKGTLWFDPKSNKLIAWILLNQGGTRYFLSFNLM